MTKYITSVFILLLVLFAGYSIYQVQQYDKYTKDTDVKNLVTHDHPLNNTNIKSLMVQNDKGKDVKLEGYLNHKINIINFWASWCEPCRNEMPEFGKFNNKIARDELVGIVGVNTQDSKKDRERFLKEYGQGYPTVVMPDELSNKLKIYNMPTTLFVDDQGVVLKTFIGELNQNKLEYIVNDIEQEMKY